MAALSADGDSDSWLYQKATVERILGQFNTHDKVTEANPDGVDGAPWNSLPETIVCRRPYYERLAHFMVHVYKIPAGKKHAGQPLACDSVRNYMGTAINRAAAKFKAGGSVETQQFFFCLDTKSSSDSATWLLKLKKKIQRITFERARDAGELQDNSESALSNPPLERRLAAARAYLLCVCCERSAGVSASSRAHGPFVFASPRVSLFTVVVVNT